MGTNLVTQVSGRAMGYAADNTVTHLKFGEIWLKDEIVAYTSYTGVFSFDVPLGVYPLVIVFKDTYFNEFFTSVQTIPYQIGQTTQRDVILLLKPDPIEIQTGEPFDIELGSSSFIFSGDLVNADRDSFEGTAKLYLKKIDPADRNDLLAAPDGLLSYDNDGRIVALETFGMAVYAFEDSSGSPLYPVGNFTWKEDGLDATNTSLWYVNPDNGKWTEWAPFEAGVTSKRDVFSLSTGDTPNLGSLPTFYCNIDRPLPYLCYLKVRVFTDQNFDRGLGGATVTVITKQIGAFVYSGFQRAVTGADGSVCVLTYCGYAAIVFVEGQGERLTAAQEQILPIGKMFKHI